LLLDSKNRFVKIADFGLSNIIVDGDFFKTSCGSPNYAAPEVISGKLYTGPEVDVWSCGVILYALLTARLPFDDEYIPLLFEKIREGRYTLPSFLSESCKDLISKMLVVDALQRITIAEIKAHPWFRQDLPKYLENFNENDTFTEFQYIDPRIVAELELKFKLPQPQIIKKLREEEEDGNSNPLIVAYRLLYDSGNYTQEGAFDQTSFIAQSLAEMSMSPSVNLAEDVPFYEEAPVPVQQHLQKQLADNLSHLNQTLSPAPRKPLHSGFINNVVRDMETTTTTTNTKNSEEKEVETLQSTADSLFVSAPPPNKIKNKWYLGILSQKLPKEIMSEVFRVLRLLNFEWKHVGCYQLRCRHVKLCKNGGKELIKLAIQLFTINTKRRHKYVNSHRSSEKKDTNIIYLLDIKRIEGELFAFLELSNRLLTELKL
jgi:serine/threonine protein kinase